MAKENRTGIRKNRSDRKGTRIPKLGYYIIVTDTEETEQNYIEGLRNSIPEALKNHLLIRVISAATADLVDYCKKIVSLDPQYRIPWIVFDRDQVKDFDQIIEKAEHNHIRVGWSNPCIEIWFYAYFGEMPTITESKVCCGRFGKIYQRYIKQNYNKSNKQIYSKLKQFGDELKAINLAKNKLSEAKKHYSKPSEMFSCTTVHELIEEINEKINEKISMESC